MQIKFSIFKIVGLALLTAGCEKSTAPLTLPPPAKYAIVNTNLSEQPAINFTGAPATLVLNIYREFLDAQMDMQLPPEALMSPITLQSEPTVARSETARLIETALREQAGIVVTRVDEKHLKVTFDNTVKKKQEK